MFHELSDMSSYSVVIGLESRTYGRQFWPTIYCSYKFCLANDTMFSEISTWQIPPTFLQLIIDSSFYYFSQYSLNESAVK